MIISRGFSELLCWVKSILDISFMLFGCLDRLLFGQSGNSWFLGILYSLKLTVGFQNLCKSMMNFKDKYEAHMLKKKMYWHPLTRELTHCCYLIFFFSWSLLFSFIFFQVNLHFYKQKSFHRMTIYYSYVLSCKYFFGCY